jgi:hypothetical protein
MPPSSEKKQTSIIATENAIVWDWDDTLLPSSYLAAKGYRLDSTERINEVDAQLKELEQTVVSVLSIAVQCGPTHIITNAEEGWVQLSAQKFLPSVLPLLKSGKIKILSARSTYETSYPQNPMKWKYCAFHSKLSDVFTDNKSQKNVLSFGDSHVEREAIRAVTKSMTNVRTKSVKFAERPSLEQLRRQLDLVVNCFKYILTHDGDLDLQLTISPSTPSSQQQETSQKQEQQEKTNQKETSSMMTDDKNSHQMTDDKNSKMQDDKHHTTNKMQDEKKENHSTSKSRSSSSTSTHRKSKSSSSSSQSSSKIASSSRSQSSFKGPLFIPSY